MKTFAEKYRPNRWEDVIGQDLIVKILKQQLESNKVNNCYLFSGPSGCGKTTIAKIFANEINKGKGKPLEIDAATNNSVENMRNLIDNANLQSIDSEYRVYILDEVHMLSTSAWNSTLKFLEDPPSHTIIILCTTDVQKIPSTVLSRLHKFNLKKIPYTLISKKIIEILKNEGLQENVDFSKEIIDFISKQCEDNLRNAIMTTETCYSNGSLLNIDEVASILNFVTFDEMIKLTTAVLEFDSKQALEIINQIYNNGFDLKQFLKNYFDFVLDICKYIKTSDKSIVNLPFNQYSNIIDSYLCSFEFFIYLLEKLNSLVVQIKWDTNPKPLIESMFLLLSTKSEE